MPGRGGDGRSVTDICFSRQINVMVCSPEVLFFSLATCFFPKFSPSINSPGAVLLSGDGLVGRVKTRVGLNVPILVKGAVSQNGQPRRANHGLLFIVYFARVGSLPLAYCRWVVAVWVGGMCYRDVINQGRLKMALLIPLVYDRSVFLSIAAKS